MTKIVPVIMSGGAGSRLWPLSRQANPKQLLPLVTEQTMVQETVERFEGERFTDPVFICNALHVDAIASQMADINRSVDAYIVEPVGRNTAPCAVVAAVHAAKKDGALVMLVPADHHVKKPEDFRLAIEKAIPAAKDGYLVTFGITPDGPETGYGYIAQGESLGKGVSKVDAFREKPDLETAKSYAAQHNGDVINLDKSIFAACPSESIDYAVMEHTNKAAVVPCEIGWNDIGSFTSLQAARAEIESDEHGNSVSAGVMSEGSQNCLVQTDGIAVSIVGLSNVGVIVHGGEVLVVNLDESQAVKKIVTRLKDGKETERL